MLRHLVLKDGRTGTPFLVELRPYFRQVAGLLVCGSVAGVVMNTAIVLPAVFLGRAINAVLAYQRHQASSGRVTESVALFMAATGATQLPRIAKRWWLGLARNRFRANVRADALRGVLAWPMESLAAMSVGGVMARVIGDVEVLGVGVGEVIVETWDTLLFSVSLVVTMFVYSPGLAALALAPVPFALGLAKLAGRLVARRTTRSRETDAALTTVLHEQLSGHRVLRLAGRATAATERIRGLASRQASAELEAVALDEALGAVYSTLLSAGVFFIIWRGAHEVATRVLSVGALVTFLQLFVRFAGRAPRIPQMANRVQAAGAAYARLRPLLALPPPFDDEPVWSSFRAGHVAGIETLPALAECSEPGYRRRAATVSFRHASFTYPGGTRPAIHDLDLDVPAGSFVAVTGPVGSGKSALARLAAGIYSPEEGRVLIDGKAASHLTPAERTRKVGYLGQDPQLFAGSVIYNVRLAAESRADGGRDTALLRAVGLAGLDADILVMPAGLDTQVGESGIRVSGGQRQRIALARALTANGTVPGVLILDEPFSALDVHTEASIAVELRNAFGRRAPLAAQATILLFSHRLAVFPSADSVVVLDGGRIEEQGTHEELLAAGGLYARIYRAQLRLGASAGQEQPGPR